MSHFAVLAILPPEAAGPDLATLLQPWHEFECTGVDDQYIQDEDRTEEILTRFQDDDSYGPDEIEKFLDEQYGVPVVGDESEIDLTGPHKYGYAIVNEGVVTKAVRRTNPDKRWDWWVIGGRYSGRMIRRGGGQVDYAVKGEVDFDAMKTWQVAQRQQRLDNLFSSLEARLTPDQVRASWKALVEALGPLRAAWGEQGGGQPFRDFAEAQEGPLGEAFRAADANGVLRGMAGLMGLGVPEDQPDLDAWVRAAPALAAWAVVDGRDKSWTERGEMGWFGMSDDEFTEEQWYARLDEILEGVPDDYQLILVDCHI